MTENTSSADSSSDSRSLNQLYAECYKLYKNLQDSSGSCNSENYQRQVKRGVHLAEQLTINVSCASLFAANETIEELPTSSLKFLLLPFLLGEFTGKLNEEDRLKIIDRVDIYYRDFLQRLTDYTLLDSDTIQELPERPVHSACSSQSASNDHNSPPAAITSTRPSFSELQSMSSRREVRIARYKQQRHLQEQLKTMESVCVDTDEGDSCVDDATLRQYYTVLLKYCSTLAVDGILSVAAERPILEQMATLRLQQSGANSAATDPRGSGPTEPTPPAGDRSGPTRALNSGAVLLTRSRLEARVFGAGYTNLPTMSVEDFYKSRVADGTFMTPEQLAESAREQARNQKQLDLEHITAEELQAEQKEKAVETDDPAELMRTRRWDEFRDECRRGDGNTYNRS